MGGRACLWGGKRWVGTLGAKTVDRYSPSLGSLWGSNPLLLFLKGIKKIEHIFQKVFNENHSLTLCGIHVCIRAMVTLVNNTCLLYSNYKQHILSFV